MFDLLSSLLREQKIELFGAISLSDCKIIKPYLLERAGIARDSGTAVIIAIPYMVKGEDNEAKNISEYAIARDYHFFCSSLFDFVLPKLVEAYPQNKFCGFADHSPIDEIDAAAKCGIGVIGKHGLLITERYSSFVFIAEIITDLVFDKKCSDAKTCENCGLCQRACPVGLKKSECLSAVTQKKGFLSEEDIVLMKKHGTAWGCDICQKACPHTKRAIKNGTAFSPIPFFSQERIPLLTYDIVKEMSDEEFSSRAYSWRGREVISRNLKALDDN